MMKTPRWIQVDSHWQNLRGLFNPILTRFFVSWFALVPIILKLIEKFPDNNNFPLGNGFIVNLELPFSWWLLWWASFFYAVSYTIFVSFCPSFVKKYKDYEEYAQKGHSPRWLVWEYYFAWQKISKEQQKKLLQRAVKKKFAKKLLQTQSYQESEVPEVEGKCTKFVFLFEDVFYEVAVGEGLSPDLQKDYFWEIFGRWSSSRIELRNIAWYFYSFSIAIAGLVTLQNIIYVLGQFLRGF